MKKIFFSAAILFLLMTSNSFAIEIWSLIHSEVKGGKWYCTYQLKGLSGSSYEKTLVKNSPCQQSIMK